MNNEYNEILDKIVREMLDQMWEDVFFIGQPEKENLHFINESGLEFIDISSEEYRLYTFPGGDVVCIEAPLKLNVSKSGGHRVLDEDGISHYIPSGWIHLEWSKKPNKPYFVK